MIISDEEYLSICDNLAAEKGYVLAQDLLEMAEEAGVKVSKKNGEYIFVGARCVVRIGIHTINKYAKDGLHNVARQLVINCIRRARTNELYKASFLVQLAEPT